MQSIADKTASWSQFIVGGKGPVEAAKAVDRKSSSPGPRGTFGGLPYLRGYGVTARASWPPAGKKVENKILAP